MAPKGWWEVGAHERLSMSPVSPASPGARLGTIGALCHGMGGGPIPCRMGFPQSQPSPHPRSHPRPCPRPCRGRHRPQGAAALAHRPHSRRRLPLPRLCGPAHQPALADQDAQVGRHGGDASCTRLGGRGLPARGGPGCCGVGTGPSPGTAQPLSPLAGSTAASRRPRGLRGTTVWALWGWHRAPHRPGLSSPLGTCWRCHGWPGMAESDGDAPGERSPVVGSHASLTPSSRQAGARRLRQPGGREGQRRGERRRGAEQGHVPLKRRPSPARSVRGLIRDAPSGTSSSAPSAGRGSTPGFAERPRGGKCRGGSRLPPRPGVDSPPAGVDRRGRRLGTGWGGHPASAPPTIRSSSLGRGRWGLRG